MKFEILFVLAALELCALGSPTAARRKRLRPRTRLPFIVGRLGAATTPCYERIGAWRQQTRLPFLALPADHQKTTKRPPLPALALAIYDDGEPSRLPRLVRCSFAEQTTKMVQLNEQEVKRYRMVSTQERRRRRADDPPDTATVVASTSDPDDTVITNVSHISDISDMENVGVVSDVGGDNLFKASNFSSNTIDDISDSGKTGSADNKESGYVVKIGDSSDDSAGNNFLKSNLSVNIVSDLSDNAKPGNVIENAGVAQNSDSGYAVKIGDSSDLSGDSAIVKGSNMSANTINEISDNANTARDPSPNAKPANVIDVPGVTENSDSSYMVKIGDSSDITSDNDFTNASDIRNTNISDIRDNAVANNSDVYVSDDLRDIVNGSDIEYIGNISDKDIGREGGGVPPDSSDRHRQSDNNEWKANRGPVGTWWRYSDWYELWPNQTTTTTTTLKPFPTSCDMYKTTTPLPVTKPGMPHHPYKQYDVTEPPCLDYYNPVYDLVMALCGHDLMDEEESTCPGRVQAVGNKFMSNDPSFGYFLN